MELSSKTKSGDAVRLWVDRDRHGAFQVFAGFAAADGAAEQRYLCHGWGVTKTQQGLVGGIIAEGRLIEVPQEDWKVIVAVREDLRNRAHVENVHLVKVFFQGDQLTVEAYTLSAGVDRETWKRIESCMRFVDSADNDILSAGDRFVGWVVKEGKEGEVESLLDIKPEWRIFPRI